MMWFVYDFLLRKAKAIPIVSHSKVHKYSQRKTDMSTLRMYTTFRGTHIKGFSRWFFLNSYGTL